MAATASISGNSRSGTCQGLSKQIGDSVNKRLGVRLIEDVLVQELNYIAKDQVRGGLKH